VSPGDEPARVAPVRVAPAPVTALAVTLAVQTIAALTLTVPSVLAPVMASDLGVPAQNVGWLISLAYLAAMLSGLNSGWLSQRRGPVRLSQWALWCCAAGIALLDCPASRWVL